MTSALGWCLRHFKTLDESNAAIHCAGVRYSPITFRIAEAIDLNPVDDDELAEAHQVLAHHGRYPLDHGR